MPVDASEWAQMKEYQMQVSDCMHDCQRDPAFQYISSKEASNSKEKGLPSGYFNERGEDALIVAQNALCELKHITSA